jgi:GTP-binding protein
VLTGRPNVGKSTLFNRLTHKRRAITSPKPGLTRDPVTDNAVIAGRPVRLVDTGGFKLDRAADGTPESLLDGVVVERALQSIERADAIVLILAAGELTAEDEELIRLLRPFSGRLVVAVNKTEGGRLLAEAWNLLTLGFDTVYPISAEHGDNIAELEKAIIAKLGTSVVGTAVTGATGAIDTSVTDSPPALITPPAGTGGTVGRVGTVGTGEAERAIRLSILGKPNTGKSTLSNRLCSTAASIVSGLPGTTRDVIEGRFEWKGRPFMVMDTAGIRRKARVSENVEYYSVNRAIGTLDTADIVILLIDALDGFSDQDKKIAALACDKGRGVIFALNKWDEMPDVKNAFNAVRDRLHYFFGQMEYAPVLPLSAKDGSGVAKLLSTAERMFGQLNAVTETSKFNAFLERAQAESPPPSGPRTRFRIKYGLQVSANPVVFRLFVSRLPAFTASYYSYICNKIRKDLPYSMVPITLEIRSSSKERRGGA